MGVVNVTPDSFSDGGRYGDKDSAVARAFELVDEGADILDIGGESTRPGAAPVALSEELRRVVPVIEAIARRGISISVDTTKAEVARAAIEAGASIINDVSAGGFDPGMLPELARQDVLVVLMHTRASPKEMQRGTWTYEGGVVAAVRRALGEAVEHAVALGIPRDHVCVDPGIGFGKTLSENLELLRSLRTFADLGPVLVGTSNKSFLGALTGRPVEERSHATAASVALSISAGADIVRVHDIRNMRDAARVADGFARSG